MNPTSLLDLLIANAERFGPRTAARYKDAGEYRDITWTDLRREVETTARGFIAMGVQPGDRVALLCETRHEWVTTELGITAAGAVSVPIFPASVSEEVQYIVAHSDAVVVVAEDPGQVAKLRAERPQLPGVRGVVQLQGRLHPAEDPWVTSMESFRQQGRAVSQTALAQRRAALGPDSLYTIIYTSGTTGFPKGVVTTHGAMLYVAESVEAIKVLDARDTQLLFLPLAHVFGRMLLVAWLKTRHTLAFAESMSTLRQNLQEVRPTILCGVPRIFEKIYGDLLHRSTGGFRARSLRLLSAWSRRSVASRPARFRFRYLFERRLLRGLSQATVGRGLNHIFGGNIRLLLSGGAPLSQEIGHFFRNAGLEILEGYGLTESCAGTSVSRPGAVKVGSVGPPLPGTELRTRPDGEILIRGPGVMKEYWKDPEATAEVMKGDWLLTGDLGKLDDSGNLWITGRKKEVIVTAGGKNIAPEKVERRFRAHPLISQVMVHGDRQKYLTALITLDPAQLRTFCAPLGSDNEPHSLQSQLPEVRKAVEQIVGQLNAGLSRHETINAFKILEKNFSPDSGEVTPTLKLKRDLIYRRYEGIFNRLYPETYV
jgi:long-chain acyl-CoA synthetase